ncbi:HD domain-containing phosphohydrolase [Cyanobium gracile]|uniref:HD-GYP domain-containing protein n=1 Tax=Cyanobium gracile TaxID=59930 RepID=UPI000318AF96
MRQLEGLQLAASVHVIGKLNVPAEILCKPRTLTDHESDLIRDHAQAGHNVFKDVASSRPSARIIQEHHERMDGSDDPNGLYGDKLMLEPRIVAIPDVMEACLRLFNDKG